MQNSLTNKQPATPHVALIAVQMMFGSAFVLGKLALTGFPSFAIVGIRVASAAFAFSLLQSLRGGFRLDKTSHYLQFAFFSLFGIILNQLLFFKGLSLTNATNASILSVMIPVFAIVISAVIGNDHLTLRKILGIIIAAAGVIYLVDPSKASFTSDTTVGNILIISNSFCYGLYVAFSKKLVSHYGALKSITWVFMMAAVVNVPIGIYSLASVDIGAVNTPTWLALGGVVLFPTILAYYWNTWALARVAPSTVVIYTYLQPVFGFSLAIIFLGEHFSLRLVFAGLLIFLGVFLVTRNRKRELISEL